MKSEAETDLTKGMVEGAIEALVDKHSQLELQLDEIRVHLPGTRFAIELNGRMTVSVHMRQMTDTERQALAADHAAQHTA
ncbi:MAG: hypothetical protein ACYCPN_00395 [Thermoplasmata archaeon]